MFSEEYLLAVIMGYEGDHDASIAICVWVPRFADFSCYCLRVGCCPFFNPYVAVKIIF